MKVLVYVRLASFSMPGSFEMELELKSELVGT